jgi:hypothetical protein
LGRRLNFSLIFSFIIDDHPLTAIRKTGQARAYFRRMRRFTLIFGLPLVCVFVVLHQRFGCSYQQDATASTTASLLRQAGICGVSLARINKARSRRRQSTSALILGQDTGRLV